MPVGSTAWSLLWLDGHVKSLMDICGACERIRYTPLSSSYRALLRHGIALYVLISPFYLIEDIGPSSFPLFLLAAYFLLGIEMVAEEIEEPFRAAETTFRSRHYCATIEVIGAGDSGPPDGEPGRPSNVSAGCVDLNKSASSSSSRPAFLADRPKVFSAPGVSGSNFAENGPFCAAIVAYRGRGGRSSRFASVLIGYVCPRVADDCREVGDSDS